MENRCLKSRHFSICAPLSASLAARLPPQNRPPPLSLLALFVSFGFLPPTCGPPSCALFHPPPPLPFRLPPPPRSTPPPRRNPDFFRIFIIEHNFKRYFT